MLIHRFLTYLPRDGGLRGSAGELPEARRILRWATDTGRQIIDSGFILTLDIHGEEKIQTSLAELPHRVFLHVLPGTARSHVAQETRTLPPSAEAWDAWAQAKVDLFNLIQAGPDQVLIFSDVLGLLPYWVAELEEGIVASSSIHDLLSVFPDLARPMDPLGITNFLMGGFSTRTAHVRIRAAAAGSTLSWTKDRGLVRGRERRLSPRTLEPDLGTKEAVGRVVDLLADKIGTFVAGSSVNVLPLTGGFDSRLMACVMKERGIPCETVTLGRRFHTEVKVAGRIAKILGLPHTVLEPRGDLDQPVPAWLQAQEGQARYGTAYIMELLGRGFTDGTPILHGLLGGNLAYGGAFFYGQDAGSTPEGVARFLVDWTTRGLTPDFTEVLGLPVATGTLLDDMIPEIVPSDNSLHSMLLWDLEFRQPRGVGAQLPYLGQEYRVGAPFYDLRQFSAWMSLPRMAHEDRRFLRWIFQERYPEVAGIPHAEERPHRLPNSLASFQHLVGRMGFDARERLARRLLPGQDQRASRSYIWALWHTPSPAFTNAQFRAFEEKGDAVRDVLGWEVEASNRLPFWERMSTTPQKAEAIRTSFFLLTEYCDWLRRTIPHLQGPTR